MSRLLIPEDISLRIGCRCYSNATKDCQRPVNLAKEKNKASMSNIIIFFSQQLKSLIQRASRTYDSRMIISPAGYDRIRARATILWEFCVKLSTVRKLVR
jgi:hypothetical protein